MSENEFDVQRDRAEELLGNAAIKALLFMRRSPHTITDPGGFLFVVLRHVFLDSVRRRGRASARARRRQRKTNTLRAPAPLAFR